jgi:hypothetical protein
MDSQRETEEKARQPETKLSAIAQTRHVARLRDAKRSRTRNAKPTHEARDRPKQSQPRAGQDRASEPGRRHAANEYVLGCWRSVADGLQSAHSKASVYHILQRVGCWTGTLA